MIRSSSNLVLGVAWLFVWSVIILNASATAGLWVPVPDPRSPGLLLLSLFFYGPPILIVTREIAERSERFPSQAERILRLVAIMFLVGLVLYALALGTYAIGTLK